MKNLFKAICYTGTIISASLVADAKENQPPNFVVVYVDDLGWVDTSVEMIRGRSDTRSHYYQTPNLESFAKQGMTFSRAYASAPVCSPARTALQHGTTPARNRQATLHPRKERVGKIAIPEALKQANENYVSAHFGKWHVPCIDPVSAGYEVTCGPTGNGEGDFMDDMKTHLPEDDPKRLFSLTKKSQDFMTDQVKKGNPFYLQLSHYAVHIWHDSLKKTREKYLKLKHPNPEPQDLKDPSEVTESEYKHNWVVNYGAQIEDLDGVFGDLLKTIDELGIADNTYVIFTSDNGGGMRGNAPLQGAKGDLTEGGIRVPMIVRGPNIPADSYNNVATVQWDYLPTFYELAGGTAPLPDSIDGGSFVEILEKGDEGKVARKTKELIFHFPWYNGEPETAIQFGDYKLLKNLDTMKAQLFKITDDISEENDLSAQYTEMARDYEKRLHKYLDSVNAENVTDLRKMFIKNLDTWLPREQASLEENRKKAAQGDKWAAKEVTRLVGYIKWMKQERQFTVDRIKLHEDR